MKNFEAATSCRSLHRIIITNIASTIFSNSVYVLSQWLSLIVVIKIGGTAQAGYFSLVLAVSGPIYQLFGMQLRAVRATDQKDEISLQSYASLRVKSSILSLFIILLISLISDPIRLSPQLLLIIGISKFIESLSDICYGELQRLQEMKNISRSILLRSISGYGIFMASFYFYGDLNVSMALLCILWTAVLVFHDLPLVSPNLQLTALPSKIFSTQIDMEEKKIMKNAVPLGVIIGINSLSSNVPVYILAANWTVKEVGEFSFLIYIVTGLSIIFGALNQNVLPRFALLHAKREYENFKKSFFQQVVIILFVGFALIILGLAVFPAIERITRSRLEINEPILFIVTLSAMLTLISSAFGTAITAMRVFAGQIKNNAIGLIAIALTAAIFIPEHGVYGGFLSICITTVCQIIMKARIFQKSIVYL